MEAMVARGEFVEWANVHGNLYGTSKRAVADVSADGKVCDPRLLEYREEAAAPRHL